MRKIFFKKFVALFMSVVMICCFIDGTVFFKSAAIEVAADNIPSPVFTETFNGGTMGIFMNIYGADTRITGDPDQLIDGGASMAFTTKPGGGWEELAQMNGAAFALKKGVVYTISFRYKTSVMNKQLAFNALVGYGNSERFIKWNTTTGEVYETVGGVDAAKCSFTDADGDGVYDAKIVVPALTADGNFFIASPDAVESDLVFDDFRIFNGEVTPPELPAPSGNYSEVARADYENDSVYSQKGFRYIYDHPVLTSAADEKISGKNSAKGVGQFLQTDPSSAPLKPGRMYTLNFKYRPVFYNGYNTNFVFCYENPSAPGGYFNNVSIFDNNGTAYDRFDVQQNNGLVRMKKEADGVISGSITFKVTNNVEGCYLIIGSAYPNPIILDDVVLYEENEESSPVYNIDFEGDGKGDNGLWFDEFKGSFVSGEQAESINGGWSVVGDTTGKVWNEVGKTRWGSGFFKPNADYTVTFKYKFLMEPLSDWGGITFNATAGGYQEPRSIRINRKGELIDAYNIDPAKCSIEKKDGYNYVTIRFRTANRSDYIMLLGQWTGNDGDSSGMVVAYDDLSLYTGSYAPQDNNSTYTKKYHELSQDGFENNGAGGCKDYFCEFTEGLGTVSNDSKEVINGSYSLKNTASGWKEFLISDPQKITFTPDKLYTFSFKFKALTENPCDTKLIGMIKTNSGNKYAWIFGDGTFDTSDGPNSLISYKIFKDDGYYLVSMTFYADGIYNRPAIGMVSGSVILDDLTVAEGYGRGSNTESAYAAAQKTLVLSEDFEKGYNNVIDEYSATSLISSEQTINGSLSLQGTVKNKEWDEIFKTNKNNFTMKGNTRYTVSFHYKINTVSENPFFALIARPENYSEPENHRFLRWTKDGNLINPSNYGGNAAASRYTDFYNITNDGNGLWTVQISFSTPEITENNPWVINVGIFNGSTSAETTVTFDDFRVYEGFDTETYPSSGYVKPDNAVLLNKETFDNSTLGIYEVPYGGAELVSGTDKIINGYFSVRGYTNSTWNETIRVKPGKIALDGGKIYTVSLRYKINSQNENTKMAFIAKPVSDENNTLNTHRFISWDKNGVYDKSWMGGILFFENHKMNDYSYAKITFSTQEGFDDYIFGFAIRDPENTAKLEISTTIDDICVYEGFYNVPDDNGVAEKKDLPALIKIAGENFETGLGIFKNPYGDGGIVYDQKVINGSFSGYGNVTKEWNETIRTEKSTLSLEKDTVYTASFRFAGEDYGNTTLFGFVAKPMSDIDNTKNSHCYMGWDLSGNVDSGWFGNILSYNLKKVDQYMLISITFRTGQFDDYSLGFAVRDVASKKGGEMVIDDFIVYKGFGCPAPEDTIHKKPLPAPVQCSYENFENGLGIFKNPYGAGGIVYDNQILNGSMSGYGNVKNAWNETIRTEKSTLVLAGNTIYTVVFRFKGIPYSDTAKFGFAAKPLSDIDNKKDSHCYMSWDAKGNVNKEWFGNILTYKVKNEAASCIISVTFRTGNFTDYSLGFAVRDIVSKKGGEMVVDDFTVYKGVGGEIAGGAVSKTYKKEKMVGTVAGFENNRFSGSGFTAYTNDTDKREPLAEISSPGINGNHAAVYTTRQPLSGTEFAFSENMISNPSELYLEPSSIYIVKFKYKVLSEPKNKGFFSLIAKSVVDTDTKHSFIGFYPNGSISWFTSNILYSEFVQKTGYYEAEVMYKTSSSEGQVIVFGGTNGGKIALDDITVSKLGGTAPRSPAPALTDGNDGRPVNDYQLDDSARKIETAISSESVTSEQNSEQPESMTESGTVPGINTEQKPENNNLFLIIGLCAAILLAAGITTALIVKKRRQGDKENK